MKWLQRLKSENAPDTHATKATKPGFVGFVACPPAPFEKIEGHLTAANDVPEPVLTTWQASLAPGTPPTTAGLSRAASLALDARIDAAPNADPDRWCWPHGDAMNGQEIDTFTARLARFTDKGMSLQDGEALADKMVKRDREQDDRRLCLECSHLQGTDRWRCGNWQRAGVAIRVRDAQLPTDFVNLLQRCDEFKDSHRPATVSSVLAGNSERPKP